LFLKTKNNLHVKNFTENFFHQVFLHCEKTSQLIFGKLVQFLDLLQFKNILEIMMREFQSFLEIPNGIDCFNVYFWIHWTMS
jgi:hypothetical protein